MFLSAIVLLFLFVPLIRPFIIILVILYTNCFYLGLDPHSYKGIIVYLLTFVPPLLIVVIDPNIFVKALSYAGIFCIVLLVVLPLSMVLCGRYWKQYHHDFRVPGRWISLVIGLLLSIGLTIILIVQGT